MNRTLAVFKKPSKIVFKVGKASEPAPFTVNDTKTGDTFLHRGAVCIRTDVSAYYALHTDDCIHSDNAKDNIEKFLNQVVFIQNLQTGRTFAVNGDNEIEFIKVTMTVEGE